MKKIISSVIYSASILLAFVAGYQFYGFQQEREAKAFFNITSDKEKKDQLSMRSFFDISAKNEKNDKTKSEK